jgi:hypothetical protein
VEAESTPAPTGPSKSKRGAKAKDARVVNFVQAFRAKHGRAPSYPELNAVHPMPKSTAQAYRRTYG